MTGMRMRMSQTLLAPKIALPACQRENSEQACCITSGCSPPHFHRYGLQQDSGKCVAASLSLDGIGAFHHSQCSHSCQYLSIFSGAGRAAAYLLWIADQGAKTLNYSLRRFGNRLPTDNASSRYCFNKHMIRPVKNCLMHS